MAAIAIAVLAMGCGNYVAPDSSVDGETDATAVDAQGRSDASAVADVTWSDGPPSDVPPDAAPPDADPCAACIASSECLEAICEAGACVERPVVDGTTCDGVDTMICVAGVCVARACGDGYREPGPVPPREACDDGNTIAGDACDPGCEPAMLVIAARPGETDAPGGGPAPSVGIDEAGRALFVWRASMGSAAYEIHARRFSSGGAPLDAAPIVVATGFASGWEARPVVAGVTDGWVVAWTSPTIDGDGAGVAYEGIASDGTVVAPLVANVETTLGQIDPTVTRIEGGFAIAWTDQSSLVPGMSGARIRARRFADGGTPIGGEIDVSTGMGDQQLPAIASGDAGFAVAWTAVGFEGAAVPTVIARRFDVGGSPIDPAPFLIADRDLVGDPVFSFGPAVAALPTGGWAFAWTSRHDDFPGDVRARIVDAAGALGPSVAIAAEPGVSERMPSVAPLRDAGFAILWHRSGSGDNLGIAAVGAALPPDAPIVEPLLGAIGSQQTGAVASAGDRIWISWSDDGVVTGVPRAFVAYLLAKE